MSSESGFSKLVCCILILLLTGTTAVVARPVSEPSIRITVDQPVYTFGSVQLSEGAFATIEASTATGYTVVRGDPKLPMITYIFEIPIGAQPVVTVTDAVWTQTSLAAEGVPVLVVPVQSSVVKLPGATAEFTMNPAAYAADGFQPSAIASAQVIGEVRGHRAVMVEVTPVQYNPVTGEVRLLTSCSISVNLPGSDMDQTRAVLTRYCSPSFDTFDQNFFDNYGTLEQGVPARQTEGYLIIVYDSFVEEIQPFADLKTTQGYGVTVTKTSQIPGGVTKENIKAYINTAYTTWPVPPTYVLLVGDSPQIPTYTGTETGTCTDLYYTTLVGSDYFPDVFIGRFSASTEAQVTTIVDKTVYYETGDFPSTDWIKKAAMTASDDGTYWSLAEGTQNFVISTYLDPAGFTSDKLYAHTYGAGTAQVLASVNAGRGIVCYTGHGSETSWGGPAFSQSNVNSLTNDGMYSFVASHACLTNQFTVGECFGETWTRAPHKGGFAFWGATDYSYWDEDDILERGMYKGWFVENIEFICGMTNYGLHEVYTYYSGGGMSKYYYEEYNLLGDPSAVVWRDTPNPNLPPNTPDAPTGPTEGVTFVTYTYSATVPSDPEGQQILMKFDWGDGNTSDFIGPYDTGETVSASHAWPVYGTYNVKVMAKDVNGSSSAWSDPLQITINDMPKINITAFTGGIKLKITVKNMIDADLTNITWTVNPQATLMLIMKGMSGMIPALGPGNETTVTTGLLVGFGPLTVNAHIGDAYKSASGFLLGPFILRLR